MSNHGMKPVVASFLLAVLCSCATNRGPKAEDFDAFGAPIALDGALPVAQVLAAPEDYAGKTIRFEGEIQGVCQTKGCWMQIGTDPHVFVKFKDYAFFVPKDSSGRKAVLEGVLKVAEISVQEQRHYLEDAGKHEEAKAVTKPVREVTFMASGVAIQKPAQ